MSGSGGVSIRAGASPRLEGRRARLRREQRRQVRRQGGREPESSSATSALLCGDCGQLGWPAPQGAAPHRHEESTALARQPPCSHCGQRSWIDLGLPSTALMLREEEEEQAQIRRTGLTPVLLATGVGLLGGSYLGLQMMAPWFGLAVGGVCGAVAGLFVYRESPKAAEVSALPVRWAMALPPEGQTSATRRGPAQASEELLTAPLTGRRCVAYEVGVRFDEDESAALGTWALLEQKVAPMAIGGEPLNPAVTHLRLRRQRLGSSELFSVPEAGRVFLEQRGLSVEGTTLELFETVVEPEQAVQVEVVGERAVLSPVDGQSFVALGASEQDRGRA